VKSEGQILHLQFALFVSTLSETKLTLH